MSQRPSSSSWQSQRTSKGKVWEKGGGLCVGEEGAQVVSCMYDPEQTCWHPWKLFSDVIRPYLLGKFGPHSSRPVVCKS